MNHQLMRLLTEDAELFQLLAHLHRAGFEAARLEVRALRVLAAEGDPSGKPVSRHDWVGRALAHIAKR